MMKAPTRLKSHKYLQRLLALERDLQSRLAERLRSRPDSPVMLSNESVATGEDPFENDVSRSLLETEEALLMEVVAALGRIDRGVFGICQECRQPISTGRLNALPYGRECINCARRAQNMALQR